MTRSMPSVTRASLVYAPAPVDNPLKGLAPYAGDVRDRFPHSLEFSYLPLASLVVGKNRYDWEPLERLLAPIAARGHQTTFRIFLEYPGKPTGVPKYLIDNGLKIHRYTYTNNAPLPPAAIETPDYEDNNLRAALRDFIGELGARYDNDPRIGFITAGLLGAWGEWHDYPRTELFASKMVQAEIMDAYTAAFRKTPILLRTPAGANDAYYADNSRRPFGYHDDSFAWATLDTGRPEDNWFFLPRMKAAKASERWKTHPIGGEIRPETWGRIFDADPGIKGAQSFSRCVEESHATWMMDSGMFSETPSPPERKKRAETAVRRMGYEFFVPNATITRTGDVATVQVSIENRGVAPFYYDWPIEFGLIGPDGRVVRSVRTENRLDSLLPGAPARIWTGRVPLTGATAGRFVIALRVPNPLPGGHPVRFANREQDADASGWLTLGALSA